MGGPPCADRGRRPGPGRPAPKIRRSRAGACCSGDSRDRGRVPGRAGAGGARPDPSRAGRAALGD
ncbi:hypothetical protein E0D97_05020 [Oricola cellulosilytica]|uniref:Uncharacterized protein n=1 Tax=Oricola cellulosilytica TaxID=1429082 RepID=A0A4R0PBT3_9HYPH|nr:hypothetical protein E0D97_05020 [Oricola cellulosilytica]